MTRSLLLIALAVGVLLLREYLGMVRAIQRSRWGWLCWHSVRGGGLAIIAGEWIGFWFLGVIH